MRALVAALVVAVGATVASGARAAEPVRVYAAGSLKAALGEIARDFERVEDVPVTIRFGASGLLRDDIAQGADIDVFASANMEHPRALAEAGKSGPPVLFAHNQLCALLRPGFEAESATLIDRMLDGGVKLGTSTPRADPSGDYAWDMFRKIDALRPGAFAVLDRKALQLTGGPASPAPPPGRGTYAAIIERGDADIMLTYCTNARQTLGEVAGARVLDLPAEIAVGADYGLAVMRGASVAGHRFALFILSQDGQAVLSRHGFNAPTGVADR